MKERVISSLFVTGCLWLIAYLYSYELKPQASYQPSYNQALETKIINPSINF